MRIFGEAKQDVDNEEREVLGKSAITELELPSLTTTITTITTIATTTTTTAVTVNNTLRYDYYRRRRRRRRRQTQRTDPPGGFRDTRCLGQGRDAMGNHTPAVRYANSEKGEIARRRYCC